MSSVFKILLLLLILNYIRFLRSDPFWKRKDRDRSGYIVGGDITDIKKYPFVVSVRLRYVHFCGGSIISKRWVLTAAHCLTDVQPRYFTILAGETDVGVHSADLGQEVKVDKIVPHPKFDSIMAYHDIGLIKVRWDFEMGKNIRTIPMASQMEIQGRDVTELSDDCTVVGWGSTLASHRGARVPLREVQLPLISYDACKRMQPMFHLIARQMCTLQEEGGKDACNGDSGGPLIVGGEAKPLLLGIVSYGDGCAKPYTPAIFTRVDAYRKWIDKVMSDGSKLRGEYLIITCLILIVIYHQCFRL